ncbi:hypothetical protein [Afifella pfennigii]|uniref:hypothetical protein n=1 Tax=Afifella pfennigii TaxID=209897 RepID=UPI0012EC69E8|nr:hypothetical protein [Afifella pfennigii]
MAAGARRSSTNETTKLKGKAMKTTLKAAILAASTMTLLACTETATQTSAPAMRTGSSADESACLSAVAQQTGNSVSVISSEFSQANTLVMVGVGPQSAPWRCLVSGGVVQEVMSMTDEGAL